MSLTTARGGEMAPETVPEIFGLPIAVQKVPKEQDSLLSVDFDCPAAEDGRQKLQETSFSKFRAQISQHAYTNVFSDVN